jgi:UDP-N-acetylglucosamine diphosphorylase / glucose-1-phosphate thymidylyltransferase / UDP-N-acetylgalactosamine diphosphorylase / glucosamine-1-phosphate N-acetyltransferase / galactosamine-1-phosphate N-acetyltransferase
VSRGEGAPRRLWLLEDGQARAWAPFAETRPVGELRFGACLLRERIEAALGMPVAGYLAPEGLVGFTEEGGTPPVAALDEPAPRETPRVVLSSRAVPEGPGAGEGSGLPASVEALRAALDRASPDGPVRIRMGGEAAGWILPAGVPVPPEEADAGEWAEAPEAVGEVLLPGHLLAGPWHLVADNAGQLRRDLAPAAPGEPATALSLGGPRTPLSPPAGVAVLGDHPVTTSGPVEVDPHVVLDAREGPIHLEAGVRIGSFTLLRGPAWIGADTTLLGGLVEAVSVGPGCKLRGEISESVILGWSNKAHDGYLGHALVGSWVNLGAGTTNSDLKNNYSPVRVPAGPEREVETGLLKVGVFLGDHVKTGIGTLLSTGTVVGAGSNVFGGSGFPPRWIPPFSWGPAAPSPARAPRPPWPATTFPASWRRQSGSWPGGAKPCRQGCAGS